MPITPLRATTLTPYHWNHLAVTGGTATIPEAIPDRAFCFALAVALGMATQSLLIPKMDYRRHLAAMPWRASMLLTSDPRLLPSLSRRSDLGVEGGYPDRVQRATKSGNFKEFYSIQEVPEGQVFRGATFGMDPFERAGTDDFVVRIGEGRTGMLRLQRDPEVKTVRLNASTARLFDMELPSSRYLLGSIQMSPEMSLQEAASVVASWK
jgi:hypothetical protein